MQALGIDTADALVFRFHAEQELRVATQAEFRCDLRMRTIGADEITDVLAAAFQRESARGAARAAIRPGEAQMRACAARFAGRTSA